MKIKVKKKKKKRTIVIQYTTIKIQSQILNKMRNESDLYIISPITSSVCRGKEKQNYVNTSFSTLEAFVMEKKVK